MIREVPEAPSDTRSERPISDNDSVSRASAMEDWDTNEATTNPKVNVRPLTSDESLVTGESSKASYMKANGVQDAGGS